MSILSGDIITAQRATINPESVDELLFLKKNPANVKLTGPLAFQGYFEISFIQFCLTFILNFATPSGMKVVFFVHNLYCIVYCIVM